MLSETKETIHEHVAVIGSQRAEIDSLRNLLDQNGIEVSQEISFNIFWLLEFGGKGGQKHWKRFFN